MALVQKEYVKSTNYLSSLIFFSNFNQFEIFLISNKKILLNHPVQRILHQKLKFSGCYIYIYIYKWNDSEYRQWVSLETRTFKNYRCLNCDNFLKKKKSYNNQSRLVSKRESFIFTIFFLKCFYIVQRVS